MKFLALLNLTHLDAINQKMPCIIPRDSETTDATNSNIVTDISDNDGGIVDFNFSEIVHGDYVIVQ